MAKINSLSAVILGCILAVHAEPPVDSYAITGENNGYDYSNSITNAAYLGSKDAQRENTDFFTGGHNAHSLISSAHQGNLGTTSYSGFSPTTHNSGFAEYTSSSSEKLAASPYSVNGHATSSFGGYTSGNTNGDSTFEGYATGLNQAGSDYNQYSNNNHKSPSYLGYSDNVSGATNSFSDTGSEGSTFRGYPGGSTRSPAMGGFGGSDHSSTPGESSFSFNGPSNEYSYGKPKDSVFSMGTSNKYLNDAYSSPSDPRYIRGGHGGLHMGNDYGSSSMYLSNSGSGSPFPGMRGSGSNLYAPGKVSKYGKYVGDYSLNPGLNYVSRDQEADYLSGGYSKGSGKVILIKEVRPSNYGSQSYSPGQPYPSKIIGNYKSKPSGYMIYPGTNVGYSSMSGLHGSFSGSNYADGHLPRGYRSSGGYSQGPGSPYPGHY